MPFRAFLTLDKSRKMWYNYIMKISELENILKEYREKYGDIDIRMCDVELDTSRDLNKNNIIVTSNNDDNPSGIEYVTIWC